MTTLKTGIASYGDGKTCSMTVARRARYRERPVQLDGLLCQGLVTRPSRTAAHHRAKGVTHRSMSRHTSRAERNRICRARYERRKA